MMYRPSQEFRLWDTWIYPTENEFHLFHLQNPVDGEWDAIGHAISRDLVHWEKCETIPMKGPEGAWDSGPTLTGMVMKYNDQYVMTFASSPPQQIGIMFSSDLYNWTKYPNNPVLKAVPPYKPNDDWRDAYLMKVDDGYEVLICARMPDEKSCIARLKSQDLIDWKVCPPIATPPVSQCEVPEYFQMGDKHYLIFACGGRIDDKSRKNSAGTRYLISDSRTGNYVMPDDSLLLGSGNGRFDCYVGRTIELDGEKILYYHNCGPRPSEGAPKLIRQNENGTLWAQYWDRLAGLETDVILDKIGEEAQKEAGWNLQNNRLVGHKDDSLSLSLLSPVVTDFNLTCNINVEKGNRASVVFRYDEEKQSGSALTLDAKSGTIEIAKFEKGELKTLDSVITGIKNSEEHTIRIFARSEFADCYLDDRFIFSTVVNETPLSGKTGFAVDSGIASFSKLRVSELESE